MQIRPAERWDVPAIRAIVGAAYAPAASRIGRAPAPVAADYDALVQAQEAWVGEADDRVVGVLVIRPAGDVLELENVAVDPASQRRGYGRALIAFAEQRARDLGLSGVTLYTNEAMVENLRFYPRLGFVETGRRVEDGYRRVFFRKSLDARLARSSPQARG
ncbi:MAG TPA: GNAT family N-acetyltransferase [Gaiellaceae bacterium]|nr:GNAT family N-acetyltransferase [Gaiellaceae bacterium]